MALPPETKVPSIPNPATDPDGFMQAMMEVVQVREGARGNPLDRGVTFRDLVDAGLAAPNPAFAGKGRIPASALITPTGAGGAGGALGTGVRPAMTVPPVPRDVVAVGTFTSILIAWAQPDYSNHAHAEILRADVNDIGQAVLIGSTISGQYADAVGTSADHYYWVRFVSTSNVKGPASGSVRGKTALDPDYVMANLLATTWQPNTAYTEFQYVRPTVDNGLMYRCSQDGTSAATEPAWPTTVGVVKTDGTAKWTTVAQTERVPFIIGTVNGLPAVVIDTAYIADATITVAKIKDAFLDNLTAIHGTLNFARIEQGNIFELTIGGDIRSETFSPFYNTGFIIRNEPGRDPATPTLLEYTAEFYGDTLFSGDIRAARIMGGIIVGNAFGIPTETDNGSFELIAIRDVVSDVVYGERADSYLNLPNCKIYYAGSTYTTFGTNSFVDLNGIPGTYYQHPYAGFTVSGPFDGPAEISADTLLKKDYFVRNGVPFNGYGRPYGNNSAIIKTAPLDVVSCSASGRNYNRYKSIHVPAMITLTRDSAFSARAFISDTIWNRSSGGAENGIWIGIRGGLTERLLCEVYFTPKTTTLRYPEQGITHVFNNTLSGVIETGYPPIAMDGGVLATTNKNRTITLSNEYVEIYAPAYQTMVGRTSAALGALALVHTRLNAGSYILIKSIPFIDTSNVGLCADVRGHWRHLSGGATSPSFPNGLDIGFAFSSSMDNDA